MEDLFEVATIATINHIERRDKGSQVIVQGAERVRLRPVAHHGDYLEAEYERLPHISLEEVGADAAHVDALLRENLELSKRIAHPLQR